MSLKVGSVVTARIGGKMLARVNGVPSRDKWVTWSQGSVGRVVDVRQIKGSSRGVRVASLVYLVKFSGGVAEMRAIHLEGGVDESERLPKAVMDAIDPDVNVPEADLEQEPGYL